MIIAVVGSGGKTSLIRQLAAKYRHEGKTVLITTTTHMYIEPDTLLTDDAAVILDALQEKGKVMAGLPQGEKIIPLSADTYRKVCTDADVVLVEADGAKHMALKFPNENEPVIPENTDRIIVVWGPHGLGKPARQVCHRLDLVTQCLGINADTVMTEDHVRKLLREGYLLPLQRSYPHIPVTVYPPL